MDSSSKILEKAFKNGYYSSEFEIGLIENSAEILVDNLSGKEVLELGCGLGIITKYLLDNGKNITVVEQSKQFIEITKAGILNFDNIEFIESDWIKIDTSRVYSDIILFRGLDCLENIDVFLEKIKLFSGNPTFHFVITNAKSFHRIASEKMGLDSTESLNKEGRSVGRIQSLHFENIEQILTSHNFKIEKWEGIGFKMLNNSEMDIQPKDRMKAFIEMGNIAGKFAAELYFRVKCV